MGVARLPLFSNSCTTATSASLLVRARPLRYRARKELGQGADIRGAIKRMPCSSYNQHWSRPLAHSSDSGHPCHHFHYLQSSQSFFQLSQKNNGNATTVTRSIADLTHRTWRTYITCDIVIVHACAVCRCDTVCRT